MSDSFDTEEFLNWLDEQQGPIAKPTMKEQWPHFPWDYVVGVTGVFVDGDGKTIKDFKEHEGEIHMANYKSDLRRAARKRMPID